MLIMLIMDVKIILVFIFYSLFLFSYVSSSRSLIVNFFNNVIGCLFIRIVLLSHLKEV